MRYQNPILPGFFPDPSICRVEDTYYLVNSTFEFFPGIPLHRSRDLVNWEFTGHCLTRPEQLNLEGCPPSAGAFAPTLRWHRGTFFMTNTNVGGGGNFIVHTQDIEKGWSDPVWIEQDGIDASLLFDEDKVYFCSTTFEGEQRGIYLCEIDPMTGEKHSESVRISRGFGGRFAEAPHLYKLFGRYYLMLAEGGTEYGHMITIGRADSPYGPFEPCPHNPILTHRDSMEEAIHCAGHGDIVEGPDGQWWMVCLAVRPLTDAVRRVMLHNLGRETFLAPMRWTEDGWPVVGDHGRLALEMDAPLSQSNMGRRLSFHDDFSAEAFGPEYLFIRNPDMGCYRRNTAAGQLELRGTGTVLSDQASPTFAGVRQRDFEAVATVTVDAQPAACGQRAGLAAYYNNDYHYEIALAFGANGPEVQLNRRVHDLEAITHRLPMEPGLPVDLQIRAGRQEYSFLFRQGDAPFTLLGQGATAGLCSEGTREMSFTGTLLGLFAEDTAAAFRRFRVGEG